MQLKYGLKLHNIALIKLVNKINVFMPRSHTDNLWTRNLYCMKIVSQDIKSNKIHELSHLRLLLFFEYCVFIIKDSILKSWLIDKRILKLKYCISKRCSYFLNRYILSPFHNTFDWFKIHTLFFWLPNSHLSFGVYK